MEKPKQFEKVITLLRKYSNTRDIEDLNEAYREALQLVFCWQYQTTPAIDPTDLADLTILIALQTYSYQLIDNWDRKVAAAKRVKEKRDKEEPSFSQIYLTPPGRTRIEKPRIQLSLIHI